MKGVLYIDQDFAAFNVVQGEGESLAFYGAMHHYVHNYVPTNCRPVKTFAYNWWIVQVEQCC